MRSGAAGAKVIVMATATIAPTHIETDTGAHWRGSWTPSLTADRDALRSLPLAQRMLLTTDATVTAALAALTAEPIGVWRLGQELVTIEHDDDELGLAAGRGILERRVVLYGSQSRWPLLHATSRIALGRLSSDARRALLTTNTAIGLVLRERRIETFRAPLLVGVLPATDDAAALLGDGLMCRRRYAIESGGAPLMVVDEQFPAAGFAQEA
jgi:chorismate-pyruvate lyase